jgi:hypothetical protein
MNVFLNIESETSNSNQNTDLLIVPGGMASWLQVLDVVVNRHSKTMLLVWGMVAMWEMLTRTSGKHTKTI